MVEITQRYFSTARSPEFASEFSKVMRVPFQGSVLEIRDVNPEGASRVPVLFVPGWGANPESYADTISLLCNQGRRVISLSFTQTAKPIHRRGWPDVLTTKAFSLIEVILSMSLVEVDVIGHSEGCMNALMAADISGSQFRHFVLVAPPGFTGRESYLRIIYRAIRNAIAGGKEYKTMTTHEKERVDLKKAHLKAWSKQKGILAPIDAMQPGRMDILPVVKKLRGNPSSPKHGFCIILGVDDPMVDMGRFQRMCHQISPLVDGFLPVAGGHEKLVTQPISYAAATYLALESLERKYT